MSTDEQDRAMEQEVQDFLTSYFGIDVAPPPGPNAPLRDHATLTGRNQPEFYADAPWRLEPDQKSIPLLFLIREANLEHPALGPWRMEQLRVEQETAAGWRPLRVYRPKSLPGVDAQGGIASGFWSYRTRLSLAGLAGATAGSGQVVTLRVLFKGSFPPHDDPPETIARYLSVHLARHGLPLGRAAANGGPRRWFYGDTHYHSAYTNDIWEFGNPVYDARQAGQALGLDWLVITDHSCDLDDKDPETGPLTRWERLYREVSRRSISDKRFRVIAGEEITLRNAPGGYVHMLAIGNLREMVLGGFWSKDDELVKKIADEVMKIAAAAGGYPADAVERLFGTVHTYEEALAQLPAETLAFAAHPYVTAQPPFGKSKWVKKELAHGRLTGHEFWNGRARRQTDPLVDPTDNPFAEPEWNDPDKAAKRDKNRLKELREWAEKKWEPLLRQGVDEWNGDGVTPTLRPVFVAGSDAHGDFNYCVGVGWDYKQHGLINDNALGRARTAVHRPEQDGSSVPAQQELLDALRQGACVVTDGPLLEGTLQQNGRTAGLGELLEIEAGGAALLEALVHSTPEFGPAAEVEVVVYTAGAGGGLERAEVPVGGETELALRGHRGYCRLFVETQGPAGERFCCFTNPIWLRNPAGGQFTLRVRAGQEMPA